MKRFANLFSIVLIVLIAMTTATAGAETGTGTGNGSGGGSDIAFALVQTSPQNGETGVNVGDSIWLLFNKNVVNMAVRDINKANIVLRDSDGDKVRAAVTMKDDQIEPEYRREIVVVPSSPLEPGTTYKLTIGSAVQAKNGDTLGKSYTVTFTTTGQKPGGQQNQTTEPTQGQTVDNTKDGSSSGQDSNVGSLPNGTGSGEESIEPDHAAAKADVFDWLLIGIGVIGLATAATIILRKKDTKNNL